MLAEASGLPDDFRAELRTLCLTPDGRHGGASSQAGSTYNIISATDRKLVIRPRVQL
jgi:beta-aspartyl-peptidase (threonine type)